MLFVTWFFIQSAGAVVVNTGGCLLAATTAKGCCDSPLNDACLDEESKALNQKLKGYQEKLGRHTAGLHDAGSEVNARIEALRNSSALTLRTAEHCEQLSKKCLAVCGPLAGPDVKNAIERCTDTAKVVRDLRDQAARDDAQAKRATRGLKAN